VEGIGLDWRKEKVIEEEEEEEKEKEEMAYVKTVSLIVIILRR